jgi:hypothetical protein
VGLKFVRATILIACTAALAGPPAYGAHTARTHHGHAAHAARAAAPQQIACTVLGCMPIPAACTPVAGKTPGGRPTGFDVIVCPPGVWPLK